MGIKRYYMPIAKAQMNFMDAKYVQMKLSVSGPPEIQQSFY